MFENSQRAGRYNPPTTVRFAGAKDLQIQTAFKFTIRYDASNVDLSVVGPFSQMLPGQSYRGRILVIGK